MTAPARTAKNRRKPTLADWPRFDERKADALWWAIAGARIDPLPPIVDHEAFTAALADIAAATIYAYDDVLGATPPGVGALVAAVAGPDGVWAVPELASSPRMFAIVAATGPAERYGAELDPAREANLAAWLALTGGEEAHEPGDGGGTASPEVPGPTAPNPPGAGPGTPQQESAE